LAKIISHVCSGLGTAILIVIILASGGLLGAQILGWQPMGILSGSMEPNYHVGGLVFIDTNAVPEDIAAGDTVAFYINEDTVVTHRVIAVDPAAGTFTTQGDANNVADAPTPFGNLIGRAGLHIPMAGYALMNLKTAKGFAAGAIMIAVLIVLFVVPVLLAPAKEPKPAGRAGNGKYEGDMLSEVESPEPRGTAQADTAAAETAGAPPGDFNSPARR
jgi:signal peptidase